jgi:hypothetical protein
MRRRRSRCTAEGAPGFGRFRPPRRLSIRALEPRRIDVVANGRGAFVASILLHLEIALELQRRRRWRRLRRQHVNRYVAACGARAFWAGASAQGDRSAPVSRCTAALVGSRSPTCDSRGERAPSSVGSRARASAPNGASASARGVRRRRADLGLALGIERNPALSSRPSRFLSSSRYFRRVIEPDLRALLANLARRIPERESRPDRGDLKN